MPLILLSVFNASAADKFNDDMMVLRKCASAASISRKSHNVLDKKIDKVRTICDITASNDSWGIQTALTDCLFQLLVSGATIITPLPRLCEGSDHSKKRIVKAGMKPRCSKRLKSAKCCFAESDLIESLALWDETQLNSIEQDKDRQLDALVSSDHSVVSSDHSVAAKIAALSKNQEVYALLLVATHTVYAPLLSARHWPDWPWTRAHCSHSWDEARESALHATHSTFEVKPACRCCCSRAPYVNKPAQAIMPEPRAVIYGVSMLLFWYGVLTLPLCDVSGHFCLEPLMAINLDVSTRSTTAPYKVSALACFEFCELILTTYTYKSEI